MRRINFIILSAILVLIFTAIGIVIVKSASNYEPLVTVTYSKSKIPAKTVITPQMLQEKKINIRLNHQLAVGNTKEIIDKKAKVDIEAGEMILKSRIGMVDEMEEIQVIDKSKRLYTLEIKGAEANGGWLMVGQYVDIVYVPNEKLTGLKNTVILQP